MILSEEEKETKSKVHQTLHRQHLNVANAIKADSVNKQTQPSYKHHPSFMQATCTFLKIYILLQGYIWIFLLVQLVMEL